MAKLKRRKTKRGNSIRNKHAAMLIRRMENRASANGWNLVFRAGMEEVNDPEALRLLAGLTVDLVISGKQVAEMTFHSDGADFTGDTDKIQSLLSPPNEEV